MTTCITAHIMTHSSVHVIRGISALVNPDNIRPGIDIKALEDKMVRGGYMAPPPDTSKEKFDQQLLEAKKMLGLDSAPEPARAPTQTPVHTQSLPPVQDSDLLLAASNAPSATGVGQGSSTMGTIGAASYGTGTTPSTPNTQNTLGTFWNDHNALTTPQDIYITAEQERSAKINSIVGTTSGALFETEKREDDKYEMLSAIDTLISELTEQGCDLSRIPKVDFNSTHEQINAVLKILRHKNDHMRFCSLAEEGLVCGALVLGDVLNGERVFFGKYRPDLSGWHNHVNVKLRRMRYDTSQVVSDVMNACNLGPSARIFLELFPNMLLYSKTRHQYRNEPGLQDDQQMTDAANRILNS